MKISTQLDMGDLSIAIAIGGVAGMIFLLSLDRKASLYENLAVLSQWVLMGLLIPFVRWGLDPWIRGMIIGVLGMLPFSVISLGRSLSHSVLILILGLLLGTATGIAGDYFIDRSLLRDLGF